MTISQNTYRKIIDNIRDGIYFVDRNRVIIFWSKGAERISGFTAEEVIGKGCAANLLTHVDSEGTSLCQGGCPLEATIRDGEPREAEVFMHHKDGHRLPVSVRTQPLTDENNTIIGGIEIFTDLSRQAATEDLVKELQRLALLDKLTHLPNRHYINKDLYNCFSEKKRSGIPFGILFIDVDNFKHFNDTYSHAAGDIMLKLIARTLTSNARPYDFFGRWGGEEFIGIIHNTSDKDLESQANRICSLIRTSYTMMKDMRLSTTVSIGATLAIKHDSMKSLVSRADRAMYQSKAEGKDRVTLILT